MTITKTINIACSAGKAFAFIANPSNWALYAIHNVKSIKQDDHGDWLMETPRGNGKLVIHPNKDLGILDHDFIDAREGIWTVPTRIVATPSGCHLMMTFSKPEQLTPSMFEEGMKLLNEELLELKKLLEEKQY